MLRKVLVGAVALLAGSATMSFAAAKDDLAAAAKKLADTSYSWTTTTESAQQGGFTPGPVEGKTQKDGLTMITTSFNDNQFVTVRKGDKVAIKGQDGWQSQAEMQAARGGGQGGQGGQGGRRGGRGGFGFGGAALPAQQVQDLIEKLDIKTDNGVYTATVTGDAVRDLAPGRGGFGGRRGGGQGGQGGNFTPPPLQNAKGSFKAWIKDGVVTKYEVSQQYSMEFNGNNVDVNRTSTTLIKDVGSTKLDVPAEAKAKLDQ